MKIAIIPARGGSKRIPRKNIKHFCGKPMIAWSIEAASKSGCFDDVIVSTDDAEIAEVAKTYGASVPFRRPPELSDDKAGTMPVMRHAVEWLTSQGVDVQHVCCLYATAPFVMAEDLQKGFDLLQGRDCSYAFSVSRYPYPIQRALRINPQGRVGMFDAEHADTRSQDLEEAWHDAGQFYWGTAHAWLEARPVLGPDSVPVVLPSYRVQDVDTQDDWDRAEWLFKAMAAEDRFSGGQ